MESYVSWLLIALHKVERFAYIEFNLEVKLYLILILYYASNILESRF
jgi:hypothetical protein